MHAAGQAPLQARGGWLEQVGGRREERAARLVQLLCEREKGSGLLILPEPGTWSASNIGFSLEDSFQ